MLEGLLAGTLLGLASAPHCVAMSGPLTAFAAVDARRVATPAATLRYQAGRVLGYGAIGAAAGTLGRGLWSFVPVEAGIVLSWALALTLALAALRLWPRSRLVTIGLRPRPVGVAAKARAKVAVLLARLPRRPLLLGLASALLPCGVLASGALLAAGSGGTLAGASVMIGLALGSGIALAVGSVVLGRVDLHHSRLAAMTLSVVLAIGGVALASRPLLVQEGRGCHHARAS